MRLRCETLRASVVSVDRSRMLWIMIAVFVASMGVTTLLAPKPRAAKPVLDPTTERDWEAEAIRRDQELFAQDPTAFWNDPHRYGAPRLEELPVEPQYRIDWNNGKPIYYVDGKQHHIGQGAWGVTHD